MTAFMEFVIVVDSYDELDNVPNDPEDDWREEWMQIVEEKELAEGDITVSETVSGKNPMPDLDDDEVPIEDILEDDLAVTDDLNIVEEDFDSELDQAFDEEDELDEE